VISTFSTESELADVLARSGCTVLLMTPRILNKSFDRLLLTRAPGLMHCAQADTRSAEFPFLLRLVVADSTASAPFTGWSDFIALGATVPDSVVNERSAALSPADPAMLFFSSGSTSQPKGILSSHRAVSLQCRRMQAQQGLGNGVRSWTANGFFWSGNFAMVLGATLHAGGCLVLQTHFEPDEAIRLIEQEQVEFVFAWPHQWSKLIESPRWRSADLHCVKYVDRDAPLAAHPSIHSDWIEPRHCYGNTETFTLITAFPANTPAEAAAHSHGQILPGNIVKIIDPVSDQICSLGETGEIAVKGPTLMMGYLGIPLDESLDDMGFFRTGDSGWLDDAGRLFWCGRLSDIIKTGGANVSPLEVDAVLREHQAVKLCQTVGVPHNELGEIVVGCVILFDDQQVSEAALRDFAAVKLAAYKVPRRILFLSEDKVTLTGTAKIKTAELRTLAAQWLTVP